MDAFNDILTVEHEAELAIDTAKKEAIAAVAAARANYQSRLQEETIKIQAMEQASLVSHQAYIAGLVKKIQSDVEVKTTALEKLFVAHKADLKSTLLKSF